MHLNVSLNTFESQFTFRCIVDYLEPFLNRLKDTSDWIEDIPNRIRDIAK